MVDIKGLNKDKLLAELYNHAHQIGLDKKSLSIDDARELLEQTTKFDYLDGRLMNVDLSSDDSFDEELYDKNNGEGLAQRIVNYMRQQETILQSKIFISYRIEDDNDVMVGGTFDNVPEDAWGAHIEVNTPTVTDTNDNLKNNNTSFDLFVGENVTVKGVLNIITLNTMPNVELYNKLDNWRRNGIESVILHGGDLLPLKQGDYAFSSQEEMAEFITKFSKEFKGSNISIKNEEKTGITR